MHRLLLIESSPTLRRGMQKLLVRHGFDVAVAADCESALGQLNDELMHGLSALVIGGPLTPSSTSEMLMRRIGEADCRALVALMLVPDTERIEPRPAGERPALLMRHWQDHALVPHLLRGHLARRALQRRVETEVKPALRVLLVDDSRTSRVKYERLLRSRPYTVITCEHAEAALAKVGDERFDLAIIDYHMPGMNGAMLCRALRELPATRELTLAILTGTYEESVISDCLAAGAAECMFKTESDQLFLARVNSMASLRERELRLDGERARLDMILASVGDGVYGVDRKGRITFVNPAALRLLHCIDDDELIGLSAHERIHHADERGRPIPSETSFLHQAYELGDSLSNWETTFWRSDGQPFSVECTLRPLHHDGECIGVVVAFRDIAERKRFDAELQWQVRHDHLTKLYNRQYFEDTLEAEIQRLKRSREHSALLFIDLDRFKHVNDSAGHAAGDALLMSIGQKLKARSRQADVVARLGGDEFAVLLRNVDDTRVLELAEKFRAMLDEIRFVYEGRAFDVSGSVGIFRLAAHTIEPAHAMNCADAACQIAKRKGRNQIHLFDAEGDAGALAESEQSWAERLRKALSRDSFALQFQPIMDLRRLAGDAFRGDDWAARLKRAVPSTLYGYEVLLRLEDTDLRLAPRAFLPQAERFELLPAIDGWVVDHVAAMIAEYRPPAELRFHVNVSTLSLLDAGYRARLTDLLERGAFAPGQLCLELKESDAMAQLAPLKPVLAELIALGLTLMLDDYGRGFGELALLRELPLASVKLDGTLVQTLTRDDLGSTMVRAMTELAHAMGMVVIAPLVEDPETLRRLHAAGADCVQGYSIGHPGDAWMTQPAPLYR